jgi:hypothetical protein
MHVGETAASAALPVWLSASQPGGAHTETSEQPKAVTKRANSLVGMHERSPTREGIEL